MADRLVISEDSVPRLPRHCKMRFDKARDCWVILAPERVLMPDDIAVEVLQRCKGDSVAAIIDDLVATFEAPRETIAKDVLAMLQDLADKGVVEA